MENTLQKTKTSEFKTLNQPVARHVLFAENDRSMQSAICKFLKGMGLEVTLADNGFEALSLFLDGSCKVVITENEMPFMNGLTLSENIKKRFPETPIILLTGCDSEDDIDKLETGKSLFYSIIFKPFSMNELQNAIEGALLY